MQKDRRGKKQSMSDEQLGILKFYYKDERRPAKVLAQIMGVKCRTLQYYVQKMNLHKSKEALSDIRKNNIKKRFNGDNNV